MTVTARTANLIIETKRIQYDSLLRTKFANDPGAKAAGRVDFLANIGISLHSEALRWASEKSFRTSTTSAAMYVPDAEWAQVLAAMDKLYTSVRDANTPERVAYIQVGAITGLMPAGYRGQYQNNELPAPITTGGNTGTMTPDVGSQQTGGNNLDQSMQYSSTPPVLSVVATIPTLPADTARVGLIAELEAALRAQGVSGPGDLGECLEMMPDATSVTTATAADFVRRALLKTEIRDCMEGRGLTLTPLGLDPKLKMAGFAAAGLLGAFILVKIAK